MVRARWTRWLLTMVCLGPATAYGSGDGEPSFPIRHAARPLTLTDGLFRLDFFAGGGQIDRRDVAIELSAGTGYGINDDFEIGLQLINVVVSPARDTGLSEPRGYLRYRWLNLGVLQAAGELDALIPTDGRFAFSLSAPILLNVVDALRLDLRPAVAAAQSPDWTATWGVGGTLSVQIADRWRIFGGGRIGGEFDDGDTMLAQPVGGTVITLGSTMPDDLELAVRGPAVRLTGDASIPRTLATDWFFVVTFRPFIRSASVRSSDPFADPEGW